MAIIRQGPAPEDHYTLIPNSLSRSADIPPRAKVVYIYLKSHRDGWGISTERVAEALGMSKETVVRAIQDLVDAGYVIREKLRGEGGTYSGWEYEVLSRPITTVGKTDHGKSPRSEKSDVGKSRPHKKTNSFKKTSSLKKTKTPALSNDWRPTAEQWSKLKEKHEGKDIDSELEKFRDWHIEKKSQYKDWNRAFDNWLKRARPSRQQLPEVDYVAAYGLENAPF